MLNNERAVEAERLGLDVVFDELTEPLAAVELGTAAPRRRTAEQAELHCLTLRCRVTREYRKNIGNSNGLFHRRRAPTLSPTPAPPESTSQPFSRPRGRLVASRSPAPRRVAGEVWFKRASQRISTDGLGSAAPHHLPKRALGHHALLSVVMPQT